MGLIHPQNPLAETRNRLLRTTFDQGERLAPGDALEVQPPAPFERLDLASCGHSPHREKPAETLAALTAFHRKIAEGAS